MYKMQKHTAVAVVRRAVLALPIFCHMSRGSTGSCGTSSATVGPNSASHVSAACSVGTPNCDAQQGPLISSASGGGSQSSCSASSSAANPDHSEISSISGSGKGGAVCTHHSP
jgi:hypothetical protein